MKIKNLTLFTNDLEAQKSFFGDTLGIEIVESTANQFSLNIGWTELTFKKSDTLGKYHYCFLIPSNAFDLALQWFKERVSILKIDEGLTYFFKDWNAKSFYFYDGDGNLAECIVRYDLKNAVDSEFKVSDLLCVNEMGTPTVEIASLNAKLENEIESYFWKGDLERFATNGSQEGLFLLVNNEIKKVWFPTQMPTSSKPYKATIKTKKGIFNIHFKDQSLTILQS